MKLIFDFTLYGITLWCLIYEMSYGIWEYKRNNKIGAFMVLFLSCTTVFFVIFLRIYSK